MTLSKILIIAPSWIGDTIMAQSLFKQLKQLNSNLDIHVLANRHLQALLERMPEISKIIISPLNHGDLHLRERYRIGRSLRQEKYDQAIVLPNSFKSALIPFWANIPKRTGWRGEMRYLLLNDMRILDPHKLPLMVERFATLALNNKHYIKNSNSQTITIPRPQLKTSPQTVATTLTKFGITTPQKPIVAFCPGAEYGPAKQWPAEYFAEVALKIAAKNCDIWIFGGPKDLEIAANIQNQCNNICTDFTGKTNLNEAIDMLSLVNIVITNDSGLMHMAAALDKKIIAIYGSSSPKFTPPLAQHVIMLSLNLDCSPCFKRICAFKHFKCLRDLHPEKVIATMEQLL